jgi:hypothetical protein
VSEVRVTYGFRVSREDQKLNMQLDALKAADDRIFKEKTSASKELLAKKFDVVFASLLNFF